MMGKNHNDVVQVKLLFKEEQCGYMHYLINNVTDQFENI